MTPIICNLPPRLSNTLLDHGLVHKMRIDADDQSASSSRLVWFPTLALGAGPIQTTSSALVREQDIKMSRHLKFFARTVLVKNNDVDAAYRSLDR